MFNMVLGINFGVCVCFVIRICQGAEYASDTQGSEYVLLCLNMPEAEPKTNVQDKEDR